MRLTTRQPDAAAAAAVLDQYEAEVRDVLGPLVFGVDDQSMETVVLDVLRHHGLTLAIAESLTGGLVSGRLTAIPGASDVFRGAVVSYASEVKYDLLEVSSGPVVNEPAAIEMAEGVQRLLGADVGLSLTGVAGPDRAGRRPRRHRLHRHRPADRLARHHRPPRLAARAGAPVRRDQRPRPAAPPPRAVRSHLNRSVSPHYVVSVGDKSCASTTGSDPASRRSPRRASGRALPTGFEPAHCGLEGRCSVRTELREPEAAAYGRQARGGR